MNKLIYKGAIGIYNYSKDDNLFVGTISGIEPHGGTFEGITPDEAEKDFFDAVDELLEVIDKKQLAPIASKKVKTTVRWVKK